MVETVASYWEPIIKIYGSSIKTELVMTTLRFSQDNLTFWGDKLQEIEDGLGRFEMAVMQGGDDHTLQFIILYEGILYQSYNKLLSDAAENSSSSMTVHSPVELLYFHGPHFQDRFGVANAAFGILKRHNLHVLAAGCSGTSICLIIEKQKAQVIAEALKKVFSVPKL